MWDLLIILKFKFVTQSRAKGVVGGGGGEPGKKIPLQKKKKDRLIAGKGKNE